MLKRLSSLVLASAALSACSSPSSTTSTSPTGPVIDCREITPGMLRLWAENTTVHVQAGRGRNDVVHVDPDLCIPRNVTVSVDDPRVATASIESSTFDIEHPTRTLRIDGVKAGSAATITLSLAVTATLASAPTAPA